jgi:hypothetical protein
LAFRKAILGYISTFTMPAASVICKVRRLQEYWRFAGINMTALTSENLCLELESGKFPSQEQRPHGYKEYQSIPSHPKPPPPTQAVIERRRLQQDREKGWIDLRGSQPQGGRHVKAQSGLIEIGDLINGVRRHPDVDADALVS